jgi:hypothetical protein
MPLRKRVTPLNYLVERRRGYIDPQEYDYPPHSTAKSALERFAPNCTCCSPGCFCWKAVEGPRLDVVLFTSTSHAKHSVEIYDRRAGTRPHAAGLSNEPYCQNCGLSQCLRDDTSPLRRRHSGISPPGSGCMGSLPVPNSNSLPYQLDYPVRSPSSPVSWPFLRRSLGLTTSSSLQEDEEQLNSTNSVLGPLGALIAELRSRPASAQIRTPFPFPMPREHKAEFTRQDMRQTWAHWIRARGRRRGEKQGQVGESDEVIVLNAESEHKWRCAEMHGWI